MKKHAMLLAIVIGILCLSGSGVNAQAIHTERVDDIVEPRWVPTEVPDYYYVITYYDGRREHSPTYYKELRLPNTTSTYTFECVRKLYMEDTYYNNVRVRSLERWEYVYTIIP